MHVAVLSANWDTNLVLTMTQQSPFFGGLVLCVLSHLAEQQKMDAFEVSWSAFYQFGLILQNPTKEWAFTQSFVYSLKKMKICSLAPAPQQIERLVQPF